MSVLGRSDADFVILVDQPVVLHFVSQKRTFDLVPRSWKSFGGENGERDGDVMERAIDEFLRLRWPVDVDRLCGVGEVEPQEIVGEHVSKTQNVIGMKMRKEDCFDLLGLDASLEHAFDGSNAAVD